MGSSPRVTGRSTSAAPPRLDERLRDREQLDELRAVALRVVAAPASGELPHEIQIRTGTMRRVAQHHAEQRDGAREAEITRRASE